jgi:hypothetical protein
MLKIKSIIYHIGYVYIFSVKFRHDLDDCKNCLNQDHFRLFKNLAGVYIYCGKYSTIFVNVLRLATPVHSYSAALC